MPTLANQESQGVTKDDDSVEEQLAGKLGID
jgi:hypothetical protein